MSLLKKKKKRTENQYFNNHSLSIPAITCRKYLTCDIFRPIREGVPAVPGQTNQKEEDLCEEEHAVPRVQRDPGVRRTGGKHRGRQSHSKSNRLRQVSGTETRFS